MAVPQNPPNKPKAKLSEGTIPMPIAFWIVLGVLLGIVVPWLLKQMADELQRWRMNKRLTGMKSQMAEARVRAAKQHAEKDAAIGARTCIINWCVSTDLTPSGFCEDHFEAGGFAGPAGR